MSPWTIHISCYEWPHSSKIRKFIPNLLPQWIDPKFAKFLQYENPRCLFVFFIWCNIIYLLINVVIDERGKNNAQNEKRRQEIIFAFQKMTHFEVFFLEHYIEFEPFIFQMSDIYCNDPHQTSVQCKYGIYWTCMKL